MHISKIEMSTLSSFSIDVEVLVDLIPFPSVESGTLAKGTPDKVLYRNNEQQRDSLRKFLTISVAFLTDASSEKIDHGNNMFYLGSVRIKTGDIKIWDVGTPQKLSNGLFKTPIVFQAGSSFSVRFETMTVSGVEIEYVRLLASKYIKELNIRRNLVEQLEVLHIANIKDSIQIQNLYCYGPGGPLLTRLLGKKPKSKISAPRVRKRYFQLLNNIINCIKRKL